MAFSPRRPNSAKHLEDKARSPGDGVNGPLETTGMDEAKTDQRVPSPEAAVNGPA